MGWLLFLGFVGVLWIYKVTFLKVTVYEYERGILYRSGKFSKVLTAGRYRMLKALADIIKVDMRPRIKTISGQEVLSADGVTLKVSIAVQYKVEKPDVAVNAVENYEDAIHVMLQTALRDIIGSGPVDELLQKRGEFGKQLMALSADKVDQIGVTLLSADIKDIMFPGELKQIFARVVKARKEGEAALEKARAETAALRSLANAAKMVEDNPLLMQLRALQSLGESSGNSLVLGVPPYGAQPKT